ncbi:DnaJ domain-containing protein [Luteimonas qiangzhengi]|uniref:DnaJ domain-containing protein n=1 Tax=Luteimonas sp. MJ146 TaxID=3129240 RepID=UPI0031BB642B
MAGGEALDLALGLLRAPSRRTQLAARPLPTGMTTLLEVAGGSHSAANAAAQSTGATPAELLEASRFFVQQVLFTEGADAYRVLGAMPDAPQATLVTHHRLLQRWLHPDRSNGEAWDSAYSAQVNEAWSRLRTPRVRQAYDDALVALGLTESESPTSHHSPPVGRGYAPDPSDPNPNRFRTFFGPAAVVAVGAVCIGLLWMVQQRDQRTQAELSAPAPDASAQGRAAATQSPSAQAVPPAQPTFKALSAVVLPAADASDPAPAPAEPVASEPTPAEQATTELVTAETGVTMERADGDPVAALQADPLPGPSLAPVDIIPLSGPSPAAVQQAAPEQPPATAHTSTAQPPTPTPDPLQLLRQAEDTVAQTALYLASDGSLIPPIWNDFSTEAAAAEARADLALRLDGNMSGRINLDSPQWRMGDEHAVLQAGYRTGAAHAPEQGELRIEMTRREQRWLVTRVHLEPAR